MKFIDFNDEAIDCISIEEWRRLAKRDNARREKSEDEEKEITLVCLSYDDGVRYDRAKKVLHKELIKCHYAEIFSYWNKKFWVLQLNFDDCPEFPFYDAKFKTKEDAIKAAQLCKKAKTMEEAGAIIAKEFPEYATDIFDFLKWHEETRKINEDTNNV